MPTEPWNQRTGGFIHIGGRKFHYFSDLIHFNLDPKTFRWADLEPMHDWYALRNAKLVGWSFGCGWNTKDEQKVMRLGNGQYHILSVLRDYQIHHYLVVFPVRVVSSHPEHVIGFEVPFGQVIERPWSRMVRIDSYQEPVALQRVDQMAQFVKGWGMYSPEGAELKNMRLYSWSQYGVDVLDFRDCRHYQGYVRCVHHYKEEAGRYRFEHVYTCVHCGHTYTTDSSD
jgi:hypothetical protein